MGIKGPFKELRALATEIGRLGGAAAQQELAENLAETALDLVAEGFRSQTDPYGQPWKDKAEPDGRPILGGRTARLRRGWHKRSVSPTGFSIGPAVDYAAHHQFGTKPYKIKARRKNALAFMSGGKKVVAREVNHPGLPRRRMVPDAGGALPVKWERAFQDTARLYLRVRFNRL